MCVTVDQLHQLELAAMLVVLSVTVVFLLLLFAVDAEAKKSRTARRQRDALQAERDELRLRLDYIERMDVMAAATRRALQGRSSR